MAALESTREIVLRRELPFPRALVWRAFTDPAHVDHWWGPEGFTIERSSMDFRVGGRRTFDMIGPDGHRWPNEIVYTEITPQTRMAWDHGDGERVWFVATITLEDLPGGGTRVTLHQLHPSAEARELVVTQYGAIEKGHEHLAKLEAYVRTHLA